MNPFTKKIPRGVIYHGLFQSLGYLLRSLLLPLDEPKKVDQFEAAFARLCGRRHCVAFPFARTAIHFTLKGLNLPPGSEILMPPITIKGIVDAVLDLGLTPVYVEIELQTAGFQLEDLERKIGPKTKAALITTLFGLVPNLSAMMALFKEKRVFVIEDFSQCLNGRYDGKKVGSFGQVGVYSSSSLKTLDTLGGGLAVTDDDSVAERLRRNQEGLSAPARGPLVQKAWVNLVRNLATSQPFFSLFTFPFLQVLRRLNPQAARKQTGHRDKHRVPRLPSLWFQRYTSVQAAIGLEHMGELGPAAGVFSMDRSRWSLGAAKSERLLDSEDAARIANADWLKSNCGVEKFPATTPASSNVYWQLILHVPDALAAQVCLAQHGVDTATSRLELVCALKDYPNRVDLPVAQELHQNGTFIPCSPNLTPKDLRRIAAAVNDYFQGQTHAP